MCSIQRSLSHLRQLLLVLPCYSSVHPRSLPIWFVFSNCSWVVIFRLTGGVSVGAGMLSTCVATRVQCYRWDVIRMVGVCVCVGAPRSGSRSNCVANTRQLGQRGTAHHGPADAVVATYLIHTHAHLIAPKTDTLRLIYLSVLHILKKTTRNM